MNIKGNVSSQAPTPTACSLQRPRATCSSCGSSPNSTSAGRTPRAPLLPVTQRWVLVPLLSKSDVTVLVYRGYLRIFFRKSNRKVTFKTEVPKCNSPAPRLCSASDVFCFDYSLHFLIWPENLGIPCGCLLSSSPSTSKHWPLLVSFCSHFYNPWSGVGGNNCLHVLMDWLTASSLSSL